jgi:hypothetical protein
MFLGRYSHAWRSLFVAVVLVGMVTAAQAAPQLCAQLFAEGTGVDNAIGLAPSQSVDLSQSRNVLQIRLDVDASEYFQPGLKLFKPLGKRRLMMPVARLSRPLARITEIDTRTDFRSSLRVGTVYTYVLKKHRFVIAQLPEMGPELFSKHLVLANSTRVLFAGELWLTEDGMLHFSNGSGTYRPSVEGLSHFESFLRSEFGLQSLQGYYINNRGLPEPVISGQVLPLAQ